MSSPYLTVEQVAERERCSTRTVHERARLYQIPHLRRAGARRLLFRLDWLELYDQGVELEVIHLDDPLGESPGRIVKPRDKRPANA
jgi:hypothetical protein